MKKFSVVLCAVLLIIFVSEQQKALALTVVDPDAYADGTDISNAFPGVILSALKSSGPNVIAYESPLATTGQNVFGNFNPYSLPEEWGDGYNDGMRVDFSLGVNFVSIDIIGNDNSDEGWLLAYNSSDVLLDKYTTAHLMAGWVETATISRSGFDISYIIAIGKEPGESVSFDNLKFNTAVPEPSTLFLLGAGLVVLVSFCRKLKQ